MTRSLWQRLTRLARSVVWCDEWLLRTVDALDGERFWYRRN